MLGVCAAAVDVSSQVKGMANSAVAPFIDIIFAIVFKVGAYPAPFGFSLHLLLFRLQIQEYCRVHRRDIVCRTY